MSRKNNRYTSEQKAKFVKRHLVDKVPVSELCESSNLQPGLYYTWQKQAVDNLEATFTSSKVRETRSEMAQQRAAEARIAELEAKLARKDSVIAQLTEELVMEKKITGAN